LNLGPPACKAGALTPELSARKTLVFSSNQKSLSTKIGSENDAGRRSSSTLDLVQDFISLSRLQGKTKKTIEWYKYLLSDFFNWFKGNIEDLTKEDLYRYFSNLQERGYRPISIDTVWRGLKAFLRYCLKEGCLFYDVTKEVRLKKPPKQYPHILTEEQVERLLKAIDKTTPQETRNYAIILTFLDTGIRLSELVNARIKDLDLTHKSLRVRGKGEKDRIVFFGRKLRNTLIEYLEKRKRLAPEDPLFCYSNGLPMKQRHVQTILKRIAKKAGLEGVRVSPHTLRHTFATFFIKNGGDVFSLQQLLGHSSITTCMVYVHMAGRALREVAQRFSPIDNL